MKSEDQISAKVRAWIHQRAAQLVLEVNLLGRIQEAMSSMVWSATVSVR